MTWRVGESIEGRHASYRIEEGPWDGLFSRCYKAKRTVHDGIEDVVVLKVRSRDSGCATTATEGQVLARLNHPNLPHFIGYEPDMKCLVQSFITGQSLDSIISARPREDSTTGRFALPPEEFFSVAIQVCQALVAMEQASLCHNVLDGRSVVFDRASRHACVLDLGVSEMVTQEVVGGDIRRFHFTADEFLEHPGGSHQADLFSLGVLLFWMASGHYPHSGDFSSVRRRSEPARLLDWALDLGRNEPWVHRLSQLVSDLTSPTPELRPASATQVRDELRDISLQFRIHNQDAPPPAYLDHTVLSALAQGSVAAQNAYVAAHNPKATSPRALTKALAEALPRAYDEATPAGIGIFDLVRRDYLREWSLLEPRERSDVWKRCCNGLLESLSSLALTDSPSMERTFQTREALRAFASARPSLFETADGLEAITAVAEARSVKARAFVTFDARYTDRETAPILQSLDMRIILVENHT